MLDIPFKKCGSKRCLTCPDLVQSTTFESSSTGRQFTGVYHFENNEEKVLSCTTTNCIYLLTCLTCLFQYTGETVQELRDRMSAHRNCADHDSSCYRVKEHFSQHCIGSGFSIHIIEKLPGNGRTNIPKGKTFEIDSDITLKRREKELGWIRLLQTSYPYGMNVKMENIPGKSSFNSVFGLLTSNKPKRKRSWSKKHSTEEGELDILTNRVIGFLRLPFQPRFAKELRKSFFSLQKSSLYTLRSRILNRCSQEFEMDKLECSPLYRIILDLFKYKLEPFVKKKAFNKKRPKLVCSVRFINKGIEMIHLPSIFRKCQSSVHFCKVKIPDVVYSFGKTIGPKIFNFKETVLSYDPLKTVQEQFGCQCASYQQFLDESCGHVATGDLNIVDNIKLREVLKKGPQHREPQSVNPDTVFVSVGHDLKEFVKKWANKEKIAETCFSQWLVEVNKCLRSRLDKIVNDYKLPKYSSVFDDTKAKACLRELKDKFVLVPVDKASKNVSVICKQFYMKVLLDELVSNDSTYYKLDSSIDNLFNVHQKYLTSIKLVPPCHRIPYMYWTPKFHKPSLSQRFIVSYASCAIKPLAKKISLALKVVLNQVKSFGNMLYNCTGVKHYWIVDNSTPIVDYLKSVNQRKAGRNIETYDFTTLYTMLEHQDILDSIYFVIDLAFKKSKYKNIAVYNKSASWANKPRSTTFSFNTESLKSSIKFLIDNSYFSVGSLCFKQVIGIPIGVDCAPPLANLVLFKYEYQFMCKLLKSNYRRALKFNGSFRLMDDISIVNGDNAFHEDMSEIYPHSLVLNKENEGSIYADILDLNIKLDNGTFNYKIYDKKDKFKFEVVNFPDLYGNISAACGYGVVKSEISRYARLSSNFDDYISRKNLLLQKLIKKHYKSDRIDNIFNSIKFT